MTGLKYSKYIITDPPPSHPELIKRKEKQIKDGSFLESTHMLRLEESVIKGALYTDFVWLWDKKGAKAVQTEAAHTHEFDEVIGLVGSRREDPYSLDAEVEVWLEDEQYIITKSCFIFVPREMKHCPIRFRRISSPIVFFSLGNGAAYIRKDFEPLDPIT